MIWIFTSPLSGSVNTHFVELLFNNNAMTNQNLKQNMQPAPSAGKHTTRAKRGKTCNYRRQAREHVTVGFVLLLIGIKNNVRYLIKLTRVFARVS